MRLGAVFRYELRLQLRRPTVWIYAAVFLTAAAGVAANYRHQAAAGGSSFDAPVAVAAAVVVATLAGLLMNAALAADAATRDAATLMEPLFLTAPVRRHEYLGGRFLAAFALYTLVLALVPLGLMLMARHMVAPELVGTFRPLTYLEAYLFIALPNAFIGTAILFMVAALSRSAVATFVTAVVLFMGTMISFQVSGTLLARWDIGGLADPFAFGALRRTMAGWTLAQRNTLPVALGGELLWNRVVWLGVAAMALGATYLLHGRQGHRATGRQGHRATGPQGHGATAVGHGVEQVAVPAARRGFGRGTRVRQTLAIARRAFLDVATSRGALVIVGFATLRVLTGPEFMEHLGVPLRATTAAVLRMMHEGDPPIILLFGPLLAIFYGGELVWKERDTRLAPLTGATPISGWAILLGKFLGLALVLAALQVLLILAAIVVQLLLDAPEIDLGFYAVTMLGLELSGYLTIAAVAVAAQVIAGGKYVGWLAAILAFAFASLAWVVGVEHPLAGWQAGPGWSWTGLRGFGPTLAPALWFKAWWATWCVLLALVARLLVVRGMDLPWRERLRRARERLTPRLAFGAVGTAGALCAIGGFIFWNTNVLNEYTTSDERLTRRAEYERRYGRYEGAPQPRLRSALLRVELYPSGRRADIAARWVFVNETGAPLDTIHVATAREVETGEIRFDRPARAALLDDELGHRIYVLGRPLAPGDALTAEFELRFAPRGFSQDGAADAVAANGTQIVLAQWLPVLGYQRDREIPGALAREQQGLPPRPHRGPEDESARHDVAGRELVDLEVVIGTEQGETAVAPGVLQRRWAEGSRAYFEYASGAPMRIEGAILSAEYAVHRSEWNGIPIEVLYDPDHPWNVERAARSIAASLEYFTRELGPYPFGVARAVERPSIGVGATAYPGMIAYGEGMALLHPERDARELDFFFAVMAHEMAHMWWGNQLVPANVDGAALLTESLAWYGAFGVVEETYGREHLERLLAIMREAYLAPMPRGGPPLIRGHDWFQAYRRGAFAMYAAREYVGSEPVSAALRRFFAAHAGGAAPLPTSLDLYAELRAATPDSLVPLIEDLFVRNVWWELAAKRAEAERLPSGEWRVTLGVDARRIQADTLSETPLPLDEIVQIGVYGEDADAAPLYLAAHRLREREQTFTVTVAKRPARAGIDPNHLLVDDEPWDNVRPVILPRDP